MKKGWLVTGLAVFLVLALALSAAAAQSFHKKGQGVEVRARVAGQIILSIKSGSEISFNVDPLNNPEDTAETVLEVMTNAPRYSIVAQIGQFLIGNYDLIKNGKFFIRSKAPGTGQGIDDWTVPKSGQITIVKDEDGLTMGEETKVEYKLSVDFSVPAGEGKLEIAYTAVAGL